MKKNKGVRFTNTANICVASNNSHRILLGSSSRLLTKRIKTTLWAFCHFLSCKVGRWTPTIPNSCSDGTQNPSETKSKTPDTGKHQCPQDSSLSRDRWAQKPRLSLLKCFDLCELYNRQQGQDDNVSLVCFTRPWQPSYWSGIKSEQLSLHCCCEDADLLSNATLPPLLRSQLSRYIFCEI